AFRAAEYRLMTAMPDLMTALQAPPSGTPLERSTAIAALLDAAVELDAHLPADVVQIYWDNWPIHTSLLFAQATGNLDQVVLDLLSKASGFRWYALANVLADAKAPGFAGTLLKGLTVRVRISVSMAATQVACLQAQSVGGC